MTLVEACEPLFQFVCRLSRSARKCGAAAAGGGGAGPGPEMAQVRSEAKGVLNECRTRAAQNKMGENYEKVEIILIYFLDSMIRSSTLSFAKQWQDMAAEKGQQAGDEDFFDQLDNTLKDTSDAATDRLAVFYTCLGLGFTGWYAGQPEVLRKKMLELASRLRGQMDADRSARICPEAYERVNTSDLVQPPARKLVGVGIVLIGLALTMFAANIALYLDKQGSMKASLKSLLDKQAALARVERGEKRGGRAMMNRLLQGFANMPGPAKIGSVIIALAGIAGMIYLFGGTTGIYVVLAGLVVLGLVLVMYQGVLSLMANRRSAPLMRSLTSNAAMAPMGITAPARRARLDDLRKNFEGGIEKFRAAGKNLYALPWYLLVGEPGSGKTEAVRHCNVGFPPGLQDQLQGCGGTLNMNWWFTNHAVILDTAGRLLFEEVEPGTSNEWQEFLKLLKRNRPNCPVNGMLLVIPAESLIRDTADSLEKKGGRIAQQLDAIQKSLGVRFPVFVLITKCDLINGFREFFDEITDPALQHQILGWSNPDPLDTPFKPELVEDHLRSVEHRLARRRAGLLVDPVNTEDPKKSRTPQVDALYAFPEAMMKIAPRLKRYLEMIFVAGEWSQKPLFLRGIYFTSSMREGSVLDQELAEAFGVPVESLPEGRIWERDRAFFLRELFVNKVFREKGLVTHASSTGKLQRARNGIVYGVAAAGLLAIGVMTWLGSRGLAQTVVSPAEFWTKVGKVYSDHLVSADPARGTSEQYLPIVSRSTLADRDFKYRGGPGDDSARYLADVPVSAERRTVAGMAAELRDQAAAKIAVPAVFKPVASVLGDNTASLAESERRAAACAIFEASILRPIVDACKVNLERDRDDAVVEPTAAGAIDQLSRLEKACTAPEGSHNKLLDLGPLMRYALRGNKDFDEKGAKADLTSIQEAYHALYSEETWPPASMRALYKHVIPEGVTVAGVSTPANDTSSVKPAPPTHTETPAPQTPPQPQPKPSAPQPQPTPTTTATTPGLKFPLAPFTSADAELSAAELAAAREARDKAPGARDTRLDAMLKALPTASHPEQICTISILPSEPPSLGKDSLPQAAPFVGVAPIGGKSGTPTGLAGKPEVRLTKLRAPGQGFELRFFASDAADAKPAAVLTVPSKWGAMYLVEHFKGQPSKPDSRRVWDVEADVGGKAVWLRLEFDTDLPELPWYP